MIAWLYIGGLEKKFLEIQVHSVPLEEMGVVIYLSSIRPLGQKSSITTMVV